jgi:hypothetical protein
MGVITVQGGAADIFGPFNANEFKSKRFICLPDVVDVDTPVIISGEDLQYNTISIVKGEVTYVTRNFPQISGCIGKVLGSF